MNSHDTMKELTKSIADLNTRVCNLQALTSAHIRPFVLWVCLIVLRTLHAMMAFAAAKSEGK